MTQDEQALVESARQYVRQLPHHVKARQGAKHLEALLALLDASRGIIDGYRYLESTKSIAVLEIYDEEVKKIVEDYTNA